MGKSNKNNTAEVLSADSTKILSESSLSDNSPSPAKSPDTNFFKKHTVLIVILSVLLLFSISTVVFLAYCTQTVTVEIGNTVSLEHITSSQFVSAVCKIDSNLLDIDTSVCGNKKIKLRFFGFLPLSSYAVVKDTQKPEFEITDLLISKGVALTPEQFVVSSNDHSKLSFTYNIDDKLLSSVGNHAVKVRATDCCGNFTEKSALLTIVDTTEKLYFDKIITKHFLEQRLAEFSPDTKFDCSEFADQGQFYVYGISDVLKYLLLVEIKDVIPPTATVFSHDTVIGNSIPNEELISDITDASDIKIDISGSVNFNAAGEYTITFKLTDAAGNISTYDSVIRVHDIKTTVSAKLGDTEKALYSKIFIDGFSNDKLSFKENNISKTLKIGVNTLTLVGKYNSIPINVCIDDGLCPEMTLKNVTKPMGTLVSPAEFIASISDKTPLTYSFATDVSTARSGSFYIGVTATDIDGNKTTHYAYLTVVNDKTPPEIYGVTNRTVIASPDMPFLLDGVYAVDKIVGSVNVTVSLDEIKPNVPGIYTVTYSAIDTVGNKATKSAYVTVLSKRSARIDITTLYQKPELPNGCEVVSLATVLKYYGYDINPVTLFKDYMPKTSSIGGDPWTTYIGNAQNYGFGCLAPCVVTTGNKYLAENNSDKKTYDVSNMPISTYEHYVDQGIPVIMWALINMNENKYLAAHFYSNGKYTPWYSWSHCLVLIGYTESTYIFSDPLNGIVEYPKDRVARCFSINYSQACIVK